MYWKTIDTAPKDQTILAYNGESVGMMKWIEGKSVDGDKYSLWIWEDEVMSDTFPNPTQPTHWLPIPELPY